jgi:hypothetical protein
VSPGGSDDRAFIERSVRLAIIGATGEPESAPPTAAG